MEVFVEIEIMYHQYVKRQKLCIGNTYDKRPLSLATRTVVNSQKRKVTKEKRRKNDVCIKLYTLYNLNLFFNLCAKTSAAAAIWGSTFFPTSHKSGQWKAWILKEKEKIKTYHGYIVLCVSQFWNVEHHDLSKAKKRHPNSLVYFDVLHENTLHFDDFHSPLKRKKN